MAKFSYPLVLIAAVLLAGVPQFSGQSMSPGEAPAPALDCMPYFLNMSDCLTFVTPRSNLTRPDPGCCTGFATLVDEQPICLCQLLGNSSAAPLPVDINRGLQLPSVCNVTTPPPSTCAVFGIPIPPISAPSPSGAEGSSPTPSMTETEVPSHTPGGAAGPAAVTSMSPGSEADTGTPPNSASTKHFMIGSAAALLMYFI